MNTSPDHPDFTALALGEHIHGTPAQALLDMMRTSVAARGEADKIRHTAEMLAFALKNQRNPGLDTARRHGIFHADPGVVRDRFAAEDFRDEVTEALPAPTVRAPRTWVYPAAAVAAVSVASIFVMRLLPGYTAPSQRNPQAHSSPEGEPTGKVMVSAPSAAQSAPRVSVTPPVPAIAPREGQLPPPQKGPELPAPQPPPPSAIAKEPPAPLPIAPAPEIPASPPSASPAPPISPLEDFATPPPPKKNRNR